MTFKDMFRYENGLDIISTDFENGLAMMRTEFPVIDFDKVKEVYSKEFGAYCPKSCDGLYYDMTDDTYYLIEFKNGKISNDVKTQVYFKILESLFMLSDILQEPAAYFRGRCVFILVFNDSKNRAAIASHVMRNAGGELVRFGVDRFEKIYLKSAYTLNARDFYVRFVKKWERSMKR